MRGLCPTASAYETTRLLKAFFRLKKKKYAVESKKNRYVGPCLTDRGAEVLALAVKLPSPDEPVPKIKTELKTPEKQIKGNVLPSPSQGFFWAQIHFSRFSHLVSPKAADVLHVDSKAMKSHPGPLPVVTYCYPAKVGDPSAVDHLVIRVDLALDPSAPEKCVTATVLSSSCVVITFSDAPVLHAKHPDDDRALGSLPMIAGLKPLMVNLVAQTTLSYKLRVTTPSSQPLDRTVEPQISRQQLHLYIACRCARPTPPHPRPVTSTKEKKDKLTHITVRNMGSTPTISGPEEGGPAMPQFSKASALGDPEADGPPADMGFPFVPQPPAPPAPAPPVKEISRRRRFADRSRAATTNAGLAAGADQEAKDNSKKRRLDKQNPLAPDQSVEKVRASAFHRLSFVISLGQRAHGQTPRCASDPARSSSWQRQKV